MAALNAVRILDADACTLRMPTGATGWFTLGLGDITEMGVDIANTVAVFGIGRKQEENPKAYDWIFRQAFPLSEGEEGIEVQVQLTNADTRSIVPGSYVWEVTLVTDPETDAEGHVIVADDSDTVYPICAVHFGTLPKFTITGTVPTI